MRLCAEGSGGQRRGFREILLALFGLKMRLALDMFLQADIHYEWFVVICFHRPIIFCSLLGSRWFLRDLDSKSRNEVTGTNVK